MKSKIARQDGDKTEKVTYSVLMDQGILDGILRLRVKMMTAQSRINRMHKTSPAPIDQTEINTSIPNTSITNTLITNQFFNILPSPLYRNPFLKQSERYSVHNSAIIPPLDILLLEHFRTVIVH